MSITLEGHRDGDTFDPFEDTDRLNAQMRRVFDVMRDGGWHTLAEVSETSGDPEASISARLRDFRKPRFGGVGVQRRYSGGGLYEYRLQQGV